MAPDNKPSADDAIQEIISTTPNEAEQIDKIAKLRGWFSPGLKGDSVFYPLIQDCLEGRTDIQTTAQSITTKNDKNADSLDLWYSIIHSARRTTHQNTIIHTKLVDLICGIQSQKPSSDQHFSMALRESYNDSPGTASGFSLPEIHAWTNLNYFFASCTASNIRDLWIFCIWAMRSALETPHNDHDSSKGGPPGAHIPSTATQRFSAYTPAAAMWVFVLGRELWEKKEDLTPKDRRQGNPGKGGQLWGGKAEFGKERWGFWKGRFGEIAGMEGVGEETRGVAREAWEAMERVETE